MNVYYYVIKDVLVVSKKQMNLSNMAEELGRRLLVPHIHALAVYGPIFAFIRIFSNTIFFKKCKLVKSDYWIYLGTPGATKGGRITKTMKIQPKVVTTTSTQPQVISIVNSSSGAKLTLPKTGKTSGWKPDAFWVSHSHRPGPQVVECGDVCLFGQGECSAFEEEGIDV